MRDSTSGRGSAQAPQQGAALTKTEALRRAIAALGYRAPVTEILAYVSEHYGIGAPAAVAAAPPAAPEPAGDDEAKKSPRRGKSKDRTNPAD
jgi:hypothetical protein